MLLNAPDILLLLLIFQLLFAGIYLYTKKNGKAVSNRLLGCFFIAIGISMADNLLLHIGVWYNYPNWATLSSAFPLLYGPLLLLYTQSLIYRSFTLSNKKLLHFLPFLLFFTLSLIQYQVQPVALKITILHAISAHHIPRYFYLGALTMIVHFCVYATVSLAAINKYKAVALNKFSSVQKINLNWLVSSIIFFVVLFVLSLLNNVFEIASQPKFNAVILLVIILLLFYFINRVIVKALQNPEYFSWMDEDEIPVKLRTDTAIDLPDKSAELNTLIVHMSENKPYLNPDLTVESLAKSLRMHPKEVSRLINDHLQQNFFDFVNRYRIREAQSLLTNNPDKKITVLEILYKSGFNSKSSFNTLFKKYTGTTPTEFKTQNFGSITDSVRIK